MSFPAIAQVDEEFEVQKLYGTRRFFRKAGEVLQPERGPRSVGLYQVTAFKPQGDKVMRLYAQTATIENGFVFVQEDELWLNAFLQEMMTFRKGCNNDQVDPRSKALEWIKSGQWQGGRGT